MLVKVIFADERYSFTTNINTNEAGAQSYYVGQWFNMGVDGDNMQQCTAIVIIDPDTKE